MADRHKKGTFECTCGITFVRQLRRVTSKSPRCAKCSMSNPSNRIKFWSTNKLKEAISNEGRLDNGRDVEEKLDDIKEELWRRDYEVMEQNIKEMTA